MKFELGIVDPHFVANGGNPVMKKEEVPMLIAVNGSLDSLVYGV